MSQFGFQSVLAFVVWLLITFWLGQHITYLTKPFVSPYATVFSAAGFTPFLKTLLQPLMTLYRGRTNAEKLQKDGICIIN